MHQVTTTVTVTQNGVTRVVGTTPDMREWDCHREARVAFAAFLSVPTQQAWHRVQSAAAAYYPAWADRMRIKIGG